VIGEWDTTTGRLLRQWEGMRAPEGKPMFLMDATLDLTQAAWMPWNIHR
jgi:hypothetical protein